jgi:hypothetical protein
LIDLDAQITCVRREIKMRERVYPRFIEAHRMTAEKAAQEIATMRAVLESIAWMKSRNIIIVNRSIGQVTSPPNEAPENM